MKTRKQKVICRVLCMVVSILLLASFFVVPVSALDEMTTYTIQNEIYNYDLGPGGNYHPDYKPYSSLKLVYGEDDLNALNYYWSDDMEEPMSVVGEAFFMRFNYNLEDNVVLLSYFIDNIFPSSTSISKNDTFIIESGSAQISVDSDELTLTKCRFSIKNSADNFDFYFEETVAATDVFDVNINSDTTYFNYPDLVFNIFGNYSSDDYCLCIEFLGESPNDYDQLTDFFVSQFKVKFGVGKSPNYPIYPSAPGGDDIGNLDSQEQQLIQDSQVGLDAGVDVMQNTGSLISDLEANLNLVAFAGALNNVLNRLILIPGLSPLVNISLSLGLFASLFGLAASIISAADRRSGQAQRESKRSSNSRSKK